MIDVHETVRELVRDSEVSRSEIVRATGVSSSSLSQWMAGTKGISLESLQLILDAIGYEIRIKKQPLRRR